MTISTLLRRLVRLETRLLSGVTDHTIVFVDADGTETESMVFSHGAPLRQVAGAAITGCG